MWFSFLISGACNLIDKDKQYDREWWERQSGFRLARGEHLETEQVLKPEEILQTEPFPRDLSRGAALAPRAWRSSLQAMGKQGPVNQGIRNAVHVAEQRRGKGCSSWCAAWDFFLDWWESLWRVYEVTWQNLTHDFEISLWCVGCC